MDELGIHWLCEDFCLKLQGHVEKHLWKFNDTKSL